VLDTTTAPCREGHRALCILALPAGKYSLFVQEKADFYLFPADMGISASSQQVLYTTFFLVAESNLQNNNYCVFIDVYIHVACFLVFSLVWLQVKHKSCVKISWIENLSFFKMK